MHTELPLGRSPSLLPTAYAGAQWVCAPTGELYKHYCTASTSFCSLALFNAPLAGARPAVFFAVANHLAAVLLQGASLGTV